MLIDCDTCVVRDVACHDCVVGVLLGTPTVPARGADAGRAPAEPGDPLPVEFGPVERRALEVLADHGLIPRLRLVTRRDEPAEQGTAAPAGRPASRPRRRDVG
jgi:hypothetical protein